MGADGSWLFAAPMVTGSALLLVDGDSTGGRPIGGIGEGPGEARIPLPLRVDSATVMAYDLGAARLTTWSRTGQPVTSRWMTGAGIPLLSLPDGRLLTRSREGQVPIPILFDPETGRRRSPIAVDDSAFQLLLPAATDDILLPVFGYWSGGIVVGDGVRFRFGLFDDGGHRVGLISLDLPARHRSAAAVEREFASLTDAGVIPRGDPAVARAVRDRLAREVIPWVGHSSSPRADERGRLWIVRGTAADSVVAELFVGTTHLGSLAVPCLDYRGAWALAPGWFGVVCAPTDPTSDQDAVLRRFRVIEPSGGSGETASH
jgi:hypothetical protein